jgi:hypothetical protein
MKKAMFILLVVMFGIGMAAAQTDILGPHSLNGHGCATCHAPHTGSVGNGGTDATTGEEYLWGRNFVVKTYQTFGFDPLVPANDTFSVTTGVAQFANSTLFHTAACLSCHDSAATAPTGMTGSSIEATADGAHPPTYLNDGTESLKNDHPVHVTYAPGGFNWPGTVDVNGSVIWSTTDAGTLNFTNGYGRPVRFYGLTASQVGGTATAGVAYVECSTCHNPHSMNWARYKINGVNNYKQSAFFIRGWYNSATGNSTTNFCRTCHYSKSNEYVNVLNVPFN